MPIGEPSSWCHRMVITLKADSSPRRTVDLSPLNSYCLRETHYVQPLFQQAKAVPRNTWKTVTDASNGFHSVSIQEDDRHFTTFITPWGRYRYKVAPQRFLASGDGYSTLMWDNELTEHWWQMIRFLELLGNNGIILNKDKLQFARRDVTFAGFRISENSIKLLQKVS